MATSLTIPTDDEIRAVHEEYARTRDAFELVYTHCRIVCEVAEQLLSHRGLDLDADLVRAGCLLHDVGVYRLFGPSGELDHANYVRHGVLGYNLLSDLGFPDRISRFCSRHTGMGLSRDDVLKQGLPIPVGDYVAESDEEKLVMYADKFHSKTEPPAFLTAAVYADDVRRFGDDHATRFSCLREQYGEPDLVLLAQAHGHTLMRPPG